MRDDEIVDVQPDTRPWWKAYRVTVDWRMFLILAVLSIAAALRGLAS